MFQCSSQEISLKVTLMYCCTCIGSNPVKSTIGVSSGVSFLVGGGRSSILQNMGNTECDVWAHGCRTVILKLDMHTFASFNNRMTQMNENQAQPFLKKKITMERTQHILLFLHSPSSLTTSLSQLLFYSCQLRNWQHPKPTDSYFTELGTGWCRLMGS